MVNAPNGSFERIKEKGSFNSKPQNSTEAELYAALCGVWLSYHKGARDILVQSDNIFVVHLFNGHKKNAKGKRTRYHEIYEEAVSQYFPDAVFTARHVKGHTKVDDRRSFCNRWCDHQAGKVMKEERAKISGHKKRKRRRNR